MKYQTLYTCLLLSRSTFSQQKITVPRLDLSDPLNLNKFKFHFVNENISELSDDIQTDLKHNYELIHNNYKVSEEYDKCMIYKEKDRFLNDGAYDPRFLDDVIADSLKRGLEIVDNTTDTSELEHLLPENIDVDFLLPIDDQQGFIKSKSLPEHKWYKILNYKAPFWQYRLTQDFNFIQYSDNVATFLLGESESNSILKDESVQIKYHSDGYYLSVIYGNGSLCDATNLPREVELQFVCDSNFDNENYFVDKKIEEITYTKESRIIWVKEPYICKYQVLIGVPGLCELDLFRNGYNDFMNSAYGKYEVICQRNADEGPNAFDRVYNWNFKEISLGREFIYMKSQTERDSDYLIYTNIISSLDGIDFNDLTNNLRRVFVQFIKPYLADTPEDFRIFRSVEPNVSNYEYDVEMFDLAGNYVCTFELNLVNHVIKVSNRLIADEPDLVHKNFIKVLISDDILLKEERESNTLSTKKEEASDDQIVHINGMSLKPMKNLDFNSDELGVDNDLAKSILEQMLKNLQQQEMNRETDD